MEPGDVPGKIAVALVTTLLQGKLAFLMVHEANGSTCFPGGKIKVGEKPVEAARRELVEEVAGIIVRNTTPVLIERAELLDATTGHPVESKELFFFLVDAFVPGSRSNPADHEFLTCHDIESMRSRILHDNWLIARGEPWAETPGKVFTVPHGFFDSPPPGYVATRCFTRKGPSVACARSD